MFTFQHGSQKLCQSGQTLPPRAGDASSAVEGVVWFTRLGAGPRLQQRDQPEVRKEYCVVEFVSVIELSKLVAIKVES